MDAPDDYAMSGKGDARPLSARPGFRMRVGRYRVIFDENRVSILAIYVGARQMELRAMANVQIIRTPAGEELVVLPRAEYEALVTAAAEAEEDAADVAIYDEAMADLAAGRDEFLPAEVSAYVLKGEGLLRSLRKWRGLTQVELAEKAGLGQGYLSDLEAGRRVGAEETLAKISAALDTPVSWLSRWKRTPR